nr:hypothetical protein BaRGS_001278 [Batillaria attramentaria]
MDAEHFKVRVSVLQWPSRAPVYHKPDGQRFAHPNTLKLRANHSYLVETLISPAKTLTSLAIHGQTLFLSQIQEDRHHRDHRKYSALWHTSGYDVNKDRTRTYIPIMFETPSKVVVAGVVE